MDSTTDRQALLAPWVELTRFWSELEGSSRVDLWNDAALLEFEQGDEITVEFGLIVSGTAGLEYLTANGRRCLVELFHSGDMIDTERHERAPQGRLTALGYCSLIAFAREEFERCASHHNDIQRAYRRQVADQTGRLRDHINDLAVKTPLERIVSALFELRRWPEQTARDVATTVLPLLRKDLASYLGIRPETLSRVLRKLIDTGLISVNRDGEGYNLDNLPALRLVANGKGTAVFEKQE